jgi:SAM-dependent methyltransferase
MTDSDAGRGEASADSADLADKRSKWEERYATRELSQFSWLTTELPQPLVELLARTDLPDGAALDLGCGPGTMTTGLATRFRPTVGFDIAERAVAIARTQPVPDGASQPVFLVAAAPDMPFRDGAFALIFDRGCLHVLPGSAWPAYFERVERMLKPAGMFQLFAARSVQQGLMARARKALGDGKGSLVERIKRLAPPSLEPIEIRKYEWAGGTKRQDQAYALFRKRG